MKIGQGAVQIDLELKGARFPPHVREHRFHARRKWRFDWAWPAQRVALEFEGGQYTASRHRSVKGFAGDCEKYNEAALLGWTLIRVTRDHLDSGAYLEWLRRALR